MELHHLRHFVAVAEELHFGHAAERLGMAQPPLSQSIQRLESSIGTQLFIRTNRKVQLTPAGHVLLEEARKILEHVEFAERLTQRAASSDLTRLCIGFVTWSLMRVLPQAIREFRRKWPGVEVRLYERVSKLQVQGLHDGSLDLGIVSLRNADIEGLEVRIVERSHIVAAIPSSWELAQRSGIMLADLAESPFVLFPKNWAPGFHAAVMAACRNVGFQPKVTQEVAQPFTMLNLVANELGVAMVQDSMHYLKPDGVTIVPIIDLPESFRTEIAIAWVPHAIPPTLKSFINLIEEYADQFIPFTTDKPAEGSHKHATDW